MDDVHRLELRFTASTRFVFLRVYRPYISILERQVSSLALSILLAHIHRHTFARRLSDQREEEAEKKTR